MAFIAFRVPAGRAGLTAGTLWSEVLDVVRSDRDAKSEGSPCDAYHLPIDTRKAQNASVPAEGWAGVNLHATAEAHDRKACEFHGPMPAPASWKISAVDCGASRPAGNSGFSTENRHPRQAAGACGIIMPIDSAWDLLSSLRCGGPELKRAGHRADKP
jgi:hypothetical protein